MSSEFAIHGNACLIASIILETISEMPDIFQSAAEFHEIPVAEMDEIRHAIAGPIARLLRDMGEQHRILALMDGRNRGKRLL